MTPTSVTIFLIALILGLCVTIFLHILTLYSETAHVYESFTTTNIHHIYNEHHLGDTIFTLMYLNQIADHLKSNNIRVKFYINPSYIEQTREFIPNSQVEVLPLDHRPENAYNIWMGKYFDTFKGNRFTQLNNYIIHTHNIFAKRAGLPIMKNYEYSDPRLLDRYETLDDSCKNLDILILNSEPKSGQYKYNKDEWDSTVRNLASKYKVITTTKVNGVPCTTDFKYSVKDIAAISTHAHYIIAVNSGPLVGCFNIDTLRYTKKWFVFDNINHYDLPKIVHPSSLAELDNYFP